ncbi:unnamed protein product [Brassica oleracea]
MFLWVISLSYLCMRLLFRLLSCWFWFILACSIRCGSSLHSSQTV